MITISFYRLRDSIENILCDNQYGFIRNRDSILQLYNLKNKLNDNDIKYAYAIDIKKAYDSVHRLKLLNILKEIGLNEFYLRIFRSYYRDCYYI